MVYGEGRVNLLRGERSRDTKCALICTGKGNVGSKGRETLRISRACKASVCIINMYLQITDMQTRQSDDRGKDGVSRVVRASSLPLEVD